MGDMEGCALAGPPERHPLQSRASGNSIGSCVPGMVTGPLGRSRAAQREADRGSLGGMLAASCRMSPTLPKIIQRPQIGGVGSRDGRPQGDNGEAQGPPGEPATGPSDAPHPSPGGGDTAQGRHRELDQEEEGRTHHGPGTPGAGRLLPPGKGPGSFEREPAGTLPSGGLHTHP